MEIAKFGKNMFRYVPYEEFRLLKKFDGYGLSNILRDKMAKTGLILAVSTDEATMALIWRGEAIAVGSGKEIKATLNDIYTWARKELEIIKHLDGC